MHLGVAFGPTPASGGGRTPPLEVAGGGTRPPPGARGGLGWLPNQQPPLFSFQIFLFKNNNNNNNFLSFIYLYF
jgi:hypothetical protein